MKEALGKKYGLDRKKLMRRTTIPKKEDLQNQNQMIDDQRTFFCSELVAKAFKILGIIENDEVSCGQFFPHHFSARGSSILHLTPGTESHEEKEIIIDGGCSGPDDLP